MPLTIAHANNKKDLEFFIEFFNPCSKSKRFIFGYNQYTKGIVYECQRLNIPIQAIIDDYSKQDYFYLKDCKIPIIPFDSLLAYATKNLSSNTLSIKVVIVVVTSQTKKALEKIQNIKKSYKDIEIKLQYLDYFAFYHANNHLNHSKNHLLDLEFFDEFIYSLDTKNTTQSQQNTANKKVSTWVDFRSHFKNHTKQYNAIYDILADTQSKDEFQKIINFRLNSSYSFMQDFEFCPKEQYWEDFYNLENIKYFFDIGAYHGETSLEFIKRAKKFHQIYFFEPEKSNFEIALKTLSPYKNVIGFNIGISDKTSSFYVAMQSTSSHLMQSNKESLLEIGDSYLIQTTSLDHLITSKQIVINDDKWGGDYDKN